MTVIQAFENLLSTFLGNVNSELVTYLSTVLAVMVFCGLLALFAGIFTRRAGRYIGIVCVISVIAITLNYVCAFRFGMLPESAVINIWA